MALSIKPYIENKERIHLIGIGGVSMNSLAELLLSKGVPVSGSDRRSRIEISVNPPAHRRLPLFFRQLHHCQFGNKSDSFSTFYHSHKGFHTSQTIGHLINLHGLHLTETDELIAKTVSFVQKPKMFACYIGSADNVMFERGFFP